jgi:hypothetical protein
MVFGGFAHTTLGVAVPANFYRGGTHSVALDYLAIVVGVVVIGACILVPLWLAWRDRRVTVAVSASLTLAVAVLLAVVDYVPLGDGRTDEVLYPALVVAGATVLTALCRWLASLVTNPRPVVATVLCGVVAAGGIVFGAVHPGAYPTLDLRGLARQVQAQQEIHPKQVVVVDTFNSFAWCYYKLSPCRLQIGGHPEWPQGFQPISTSRSTYIPKEYFGPFNDAATALRGVNEVWYVGYDYGTYDVGSPEFAHVPAHPGLLKKLLSLGFTDATGPHSLLTADDVYAQLLVRRAA